MKFSELFTSRFLTVSNTLSLSRVFLVPVFWYLLDQTRFGEHTNSYLLLVIAGMTLTDFFDGLLARKLGQETPLGQYLDPVADKVVIISCLSMLCYYRGYPIWIVVFVIMREALGFSLGAFLFFKKDILGKPNYWGKFGVAFVALSGVFYIMEWPYKDIINFLVLVVWISGIISYAKKYWKTIFE